MGFYDKYMLPRLIDMAYRVKPVRRQREKVVPRARGRVLEIGIGTGLNIPYYDPTRVEKVWGLDPALEMHKLAAKRSARSRIEIELIGSSGEQIPMDDESFDTVLVTYTLCSISGVLSALREMRRVLTPLWRKLAGGCHLDRPIPELIRQAGFKVQDLETLYLPGPRPLTFNYRGSARPDRSAGVEERGPAIHRGATRRNRSRNLT